MTLSIIIPMYNSRRYVGKCISSCFNQGLNVSDFEIIVINDKSTDGSEAIVEQLQTRHSNIKLINHPVNMGQDIARRTGLVHASGKYVVFIDNDDWFVKDSLGHLINQAQINGYDMVMGAKRVVYTVSHLPLLSKKIKQSFYGELVGDEAIRKYWLSFFGLSLLPIFITGAIVRRELLKPEYFSEGMRFWEDICEVMQIFPNYKLICYCDIVSYNYRVGGSTSSFNPRLYTDHKLFFKKRLEMIERYDYEEGRYYACGEMKNIFKTHVAKMIRLKVAPESEIKQFISKELHDSIWHDVFVADFPERFKNKPFTEAMINKDVDAIYSICKNKSSHDRLKNCISNLLINLLVR